MPMKIPKPSRAEEKALFRLGVVGDLLARDLQHGELQDELVARSQRRYRPPGAKASRTFHWKTLQDWYYAAKEKGLEGLLPASRSRGHALALDEDQRALLADMRAENPTAPADLILSEAVRNGAIDKGAVSEETVRRLLRDKDLPRKQVNRSERRGRRRWQADRACKIWHADVCHVWRRDADGQPHKAYVHGILDDCTRYVVALEAREHEREVDLLSVLCAALLRYPAPEALYVDNGACYRGDVLALCCERLGIRLVHAAPYDPESRGKMERFWRTMRGRCTDFLPAGASLHDVNAALLAFLDEDYHRRPHAGLLGDRPIRRFQEEIVALASPRTARELAEALEVTVTCLVRKDATFQLDGRLFEVAGRHLAGKKITLVVDPFDGAPLRASYQDKPVVIGSCDPVRNGRRGRPEIAANAKKTTPFDPIAALLAAARQEKP